MTALRSRLTWLGPPVVLVLILLSPAVFGPAWHLLHGNSIRYRGWEVPVPFFFFNHPNSEGLMLTRITAGTLWWHGPTGDIRLFPIPDGRKFDYRTEYKKLGEGAAMAAKGLHFVAAKKLPVGGTFAYCFEFASLDKKAQSQIACGIDGSTILPFYFGSSRYVPDFYATLEGMSHTGANPK